MTTLIDKTVKKYNMLQSGDTVCVGVSGGADSMLLLTYLFENREKYGIKVIAANVEHGIRGETSKADTEFVKAYCAEKGIEFRGISINAPEEAKAAGLGVEEYSRKARYEFFASLSCDKIATAHSLSDNVETVLFRLARGTSLKGMCGIPPVRDNVIRPLIELTSAEIRSYCKENGIPFVIDETNAENDYARNYIRNEIIPRFEELNPSFETAANRLISGVNEAEELLETEAAKLEFPLSCEALKNCGAAVAKTAIRLYAEKNGITPDEKHISAVYALAFGGNKTQLKGSVFAVRENGFIVIKSLSSEIPNPVFRTETVILNKEDFLKKFEFLKNEFTFYCDCDKIIGSVTVRSRLSGDEITPAKRGCTKSLKKLMNELKIPESERPYIPVICDEKGVIGLYGYVCGERVAADGNTENYCLFRICPEDID